MEILKATIVNLLNKTQKFVIPFYQRTYDWSKSEIDKLIDDVNRNTKDEYFLGTIFLKNKGSSLIIVDGQQRITTLSLMITALNSEVIKSNLSEQNKIDLEKNFSILVNKKFDFETKNSFNTKTLLKIIKNQTLDDNDKSSKYYLNYLDIFNKFIKFGENINKFYTNLKKVIFSQVIADQEIDEHIMFSQINSTGKKLNAFDLVKNHLFSELANEYQGEEIDDYINDNLNKLYSVSDYLKNSDNSDKELNELVKRFLSYLTYELVNNNENKIYNYYLKTYQKFKENQNNTAYNFFEQFYFFAKIYKFIYNNEYYNYSFKNELDFLNSTFKTYSNILIFTIMNHCKLDMDNNSNDIHIDDKDIVKIKNILNVIEYYKINRMFCGLQEKTITRMIPTLIKTIKANNDKDIASVIYWSLFVEPYQNNNDPPKYAAGTNNQFETGFNTFNIYTENANFVKSLLIRINTFIDNKTNTDYSKYSIEHILPQNYDLWKEFIKDSELEIENHLHTIGNLTLTNYNSNYSNNLFDKKIKVMKEKESFPLNNYLFDLKEWNVEQIKKRSEWLLTKIKEIYKFDFAEFNIDNINLMDLKNNDLLEIKAETLDKNISYFKYLNDIDKDMIFNICKLYYVDKKSYEKIEKEYLKVNKLKGWITQSIIDWLRIKIETRPIKIDEFNKIINDYQDDINNLVNYINNKINE